MTDELPPFPRAGPYKTLTAQCHCKSTHFTVKVPTSDLPLSVYLCHCSICRYTHGTLCSFQTPLPYGVEPDFVSPSSVESSLTGYMHEEATFERFFCTTCGCHIGERGLREDPSTGLDDWCVTSSIFDTHDEDTFRILSHNFPNPTTEPNLATWLPSVNGRTIHPWNPYPSDPRSALAHARPPEPDLPDRNRLLAQCHCGGVRFTLPRPSEAEAAHPFLSRYLRTGPTPSSAPPNPDTTDNATSTTSTTTTNPATDSAHAHTPATGPPTLKRLACLCLCTSCRLTSGTHAVASTYAPLSRLEPAIPSSLDGIGTLRAYHSSEIVTRAFCSVCGATALYAADHPDRVRDGEVVVAVAVGLLRDWEGSVAVEGWLAWRTGEVAGVGDGRGFDGGVAEGLAEGLGRWGVERYGRRERFGIPQD